MPELPDLVVYLEALDRVVRGRTIRRVRLASAFVVRSVDPPIAAVEGGTVIGLARLGKRIVLRCDRDLAVVMHLMIAGRLRWRPPAAAIPRRLGLAAFDFDHGTLLLTEASRKQRAAIHVVRGAAAVAALDPGGLEVLNASLEAFGAAVRRENHTLKRTLTDPTILSGIGNAYSDEILHAARLSPLAMSSKLQDDEIERLYQATRTTLQRWIDRLRREAGEFPENVTAFRDGMAVHGRYREPCRACGAPVQRIRYAENEVNYCAVCQTGGRVLDDRALSRLLRRDWPRSLETWERLFAGEEKPG